MKNHLTEEYEIIAVHKGLSNNPKYNYGVMMKQVQIIHPNIKKAISGHAFENEFK